MHFLQKMRVNAEKLNWINSLNPQEEVEVVRIVGKMGMVLKRMNFTEKLNNMMQ